ncbi:uncharacterized protein [Periplaneta americana]|uniref:uncharacterized protein n=1 Tax=Periplaneta americana TaxID=6978 RepID=UPI0037E7823A
MKRLPSVLFQKRDSWSEEEKLIDKLYRSRMKTTYQIGYCREYPKIGEEGTSADIEDVFLKQMEDYYRPPSERGKVPAPLPTTRRVFAYGRPDLFKTGLSEYRDGISRQAFNIFMRDKAAGIVRLSRHKGPAGATSLADEPTFPPAIPRKRQVALNKHLV